jgi:Major Facilitator Superfamily
MRKWWPLVAVATAQFVMVLDQSVMNVSISTLVADFDTTVTTIQGVITLYCLVMAMLMMTGAKVGDIVGRRKAFVIGLVIYGCGSLITAVAPTVAVLTLGWSILEGIGAAMVLPAMAALIAGNFEGRQRKVAYAVIGGVNFVRLSRLPDGRRWRSTPAVRAANSASSGSVATSTSFLMPATAILSKAAIRRANASMKPSISPSGMTRFTYPYSAARARRRGRRRRAGSPARGRGSAND